MQKSYFHILNNFNKLQLKS